MSSRLYSHDRGYRPIGDYAAIGDCHGSALVALDGGIDWCCLDRFDADPLFCRLVDAARGGFLSTAPVASHTVSRAYLNDTNVLRTEFTSDSGRVVLTDFMPVGRAPGARIHDYVTLRARGWLIRRIECIAGEIAVRVAYRPSVAFGALPVRLERAHGGIAIAAGGAVLHSDLDLKIHDDYADGEAILRAGERRFVVVGMPRLHVSVEEIERLLGITCAFWREWIAYCRYGGPYAQSVRRGALVLKLMTYAPTGALVAALTTSLPERIGGERNWDYRYCWIRDASLVLQALASLGYSGEVTRFFRFMDDALEAPVEQLQIMYGIRMERVLTERRLEHLEGYAHSRPVRTGNGAYSQRQTDLYGYLLEGALAYKALGGKISSQEKRAYARVVDFIAACWQESDFGLWESRAGPRHFVHSKAMCWVVVDRAIRLVGERPDWVALRDRIWDEIMARGRASEGHFVQSLAPDRPFMDASLLQLAMMGAPVDAKTLERTRIAVERELREGDFVHRYRSDDGLEGAEGAFLVCSFWLVDALLFDGRGQEARELFERLCNHANDVGLFAEELDAASGAFLGNFPQAFTHLGLVASAVNLELFEKYGAPALQGTYADRARRAVTATLGWKGLLAGWLHSRKFRLRSSRQSVLSWAERR
jgi:GH15 family glucan-1,4-alpha-glucosidase